MCGGEREKPDKREREKKSFSLSFFSFFVSFFFPRVKNNEFHYFFPALFIIIASKEEKKVRRGRFGGEGERLFSSRGEEGEEEKRKRGERRFERKKKTFPLAQKPLCAPFFFFIFFQFSTLPVFSTCACVVKTLFPSSPLALGAC